MTARRVGALALTLAAAALLLGLGVWQVERRAWKLDLIARTDARLAAPPVAPPPPAAWPRVGRGDEYLKLHAQGRWLPVAPAYAQAVIDDGPGWWVLSPLATDRGTVLINRGFVAEEARGHEPPATGVASVTGLLRLGEPGGGFLRHNDPAHDRWFSRDPAAIAAARHLGPVAPFFIDADRATSPDVPRGGLSVVSFPNNHLVYAITWFSLAALALWFAWRLAASRDEG